MTAPEVPDWAIEQALKECGFAMTPAATRTDAADETHWAVAVLALARRIAKDREE